MPFSQRFGCLLQLTSCMRVSRPAFFTNVLFFFLTVVCWITFIWSVVSSYVRFYYPGQKREPCSWCIKSESCDIEESRCLMQLRNRERTRLATATTTRIDESRRNQTADSSISHDASQGWVPHVPFQTKYPSQTAVAVSL